MHLQTRLNCSLGLSSSPCLCLSPVRAELRTESRLFFLLARPAEARLRPPTRIISHIAQGAHGGVAQPETRGRGTVHCSCCPHQYGLV